MKGTASKSNVEVNRNGDGMAVTGGDVLEGRYPSEKWGKQKVSFSLCVVPAGEQQHMAALVEKKATSLPRARGEGVGRERGSGTAAQPALVKHGAGGAARCVATGGTLLWLKYKTKRTSQSLRSSFCCRNVPAKVPVEALTLPSDGPQRCAEYACAEDNDDETSLYRMGGAENVHSA